MAVKNVVSFAWCLVWTYQLATCFFPAWLMTLSTGADEAWKEVSGQILVPRLFFPSTSEK